MAIQERGTAHWVIAVQAVISVCCLCVVACSCAIAIVKCREGNLMAAEQPEPIDFDSASRARIEDVREQ